MNTPSRNSATAFAQLESSGDESARPRKRQRTQSAKSTNTKSVNASPYTASTVDTDPTSYGSSFFDDDVDVESRPRKKEKVKRRTLSHIAATGPAYPRSEYQDWEPPLLPVPEWQAASELWRSTGQNGDRNNEDEEYVYFTLDHFSVYRPRRTGQLKYEDRSKELVALDRLQNRNGCANFLFDGVLSVGREQRYVQGVPFSTLTIEGYGDEDVADLAGKICIQSCEAAANYTDVWYCLGEPAAEYRRFFEPFQWLAQFTKYFVDYLLVHEHVAINEFRAEFITWLRGLQESKAAFRRWLSGAPASLDFRTTVNAHIGYLWKESHSILDDERIRKHPIWSEIDPLQLSAIPQQHNAEQATVVTPLTYECFKNMYFADRLDERSLSLSKSVASHINRRKLDMSLTPLGAQGLDRHSPITTRQSAEHATNSGASAIDVRQGDVVCVIPEKQSSWRSSAEVWYAYVRCVRDVPRHTERKLLDVLWLYEPADTTLGSAYYPFDNELFLSDNCGCGDEAVDIDCVVAKVEITWFAKDPAAASDLFVRQKFRTVHEDDMYDFMALKSDDFTCVHHDQSTDFEECADFEECTATYKLNDTILFRAWSEEKAEESLEPGQIVDFDYTLRQVSLRLFAYEAAINCDARPNELTLTNQVASVGPAKIVRRCHVRSFPQSIVQTGLPTPYDRDGAGDFFFLSELTSDTQSQSSHDWIRTSVASSLPNPGMNSPTDVESETKLRGMGIFCGGGNFDRGFEDAGAVEFRYAIDWAEKALHSYRANVADPGAVKFWLGSVNDYVAQAIAGSSDSRIARPGDVDIIAAGSPCPGFSTLQGDKFSVGSKTNASMVASVISFVDIYSPRYCVLENVVAMTHAAGVKGNENVFCQILAALVALGYQVQQFLVDAWSVGSSQQRSRLFIVASAPGTAPLPVPPLTHRHLDDMPAIRSLGRSSNGLPFGSRKNECTPFLHVSAKEATKDLPDIGDSQPQICTAFPDHRTPMEHGKRHRNRIAMIPTRPNGMGLIQAMNQGLLFGEPLQWASTFGKVRAGPRSKTFSRIYPDGLFLTITTALRIHDGMNGRCLHWDQHRCMTVMEARRAQGFLDHEAIIGSPAEQIKIIGNSVDRKVSLALGLSLRESWFKTSPPAQGKVETRELVIQSKARLIEREPDCRLHVTDDHDDSAVLGHSDVISISSSAPDEELRVLNDHDDDDDDDDGAMVGHSDVISISSSEPATPDHVRESWIQQSQNGTLRLSDAQKQEIRTGGFKAIVRMLPTLSSSPREEADVI